MTPALKLIRVSAAAKLANVTTSRIYMAVADKELTSHTLMDYRAIDEDELRRWIDRPKRNAK